MRDNDGLTFSQVVKYFLAAFVVILAVSWVAQGNDWFMYKVFAPKYEQVRRETFEQTKSYRQGMVQELQNMQFEYVKANEEQKAALADLILHRAADFDLDDNRVPSELRSFVNQLRRERTSAR